MSTVSADTARETFARLRTHMSPGVALSAKFAGAGAVEVDAAGAMVTLSDGRRLLDFGSYAVTLLGHANPTVVAAVAVTGATGVVGSEVVASLDRHFPQADVVGVVRRRPPAGSVAVDDGSGAAARRAPRALGRHRPHGRVHPMEHDS